MSIDTNGDLQEQLAKAKAEINEVKAENVRLRRSMATLGAIVQDAIHECNETMVGAR